MEFADWEPVYTALLAELGFDRQGDELARDLLGELIGGAETYPITALPGSDQTVVIAGGGPSLTTELERIETADAVYAASTAADRLHDAGLTVDCVVTDLDKHADAVPRFSRNGTPVAIHAHGDNRALLREVVPACDPGTVIPTTQAAPAGKVRNFGGFTDGDRAAYLADHRGAARLTFAGWDFEDTTLAAGKAAKLDWAERLLRWLEQRRGEQFAVLDGRRAGIDTTIFPG
jgi:uncharacterized Rossmann fold enzyme